MAGQPAEASFELRPPIVMAGLDPAIHANIRPGAIPAFFLVVIPGRAQREPGIHNHDGEYGFRACAKGRIPE